MKLLFLVFVSSIFLAGCSFVDKNITWIGFYYPNQEYSTNLIDQRRALDQSPKFNTIQDCMKWGKDYLKSNSKDGFECSYGCRIENESYLICKDTTKMITNIANEGTYTP